MEAIPTKESFKEIWKILEENEYDIPFAEIAKILGESRSTIYQRILEMDKEGIPVTKKMEQIKKEKKKRQQEEKLRGEKERREQRKEKQKEKNERPQPLTPKEEKALDIFEGIGNVKKTYSELQKLGVSAATVVSLVRKFSSKNLLEEDAIRIAKWIKQQKELDRLVSEVKKTREIRYDNIKLLIDELLKDPQEDKTQAIYFVIAYTQILMDRGMKRVEEPLYQLLDQYKVKLNRKDQFQRIQAILAQYEERVNRKSLLFIQEKEEGFR